MPDPWLDVITAIKIISQNYWLCLEETYLFSLKQRRVGFDYCLNLQKYYRKPRQTRVVHYMNFLEVFDISFCN